MNNQAWNVWLKPQKCVGFYSIIVTSHRILENTLFILYSWSYVINGDFLSFLASDWWLLKSISIKKNRWVYSFFCLFSWTLYFDFKKCVLFHPVHMNTSFLFESNCKNLPYSLIIKKSRKDAWKPLFPSVIVDGNMS